MLYECDYEYVRSISIKEVLRYMSALDPDDAYEVYQILSNNRQKLVYDSLMDWNPYLYRYITIRLGGII
jgi:hypothetical protein